jgi:MauM/NapG family ferredoxin protein
MRSLRKTRLISQITFTVLILLTIFLVNKYPLPYKWPADWFLRLNPLVPILTSIASGTFITRVIYISLFTLVLTVFFGRVFCGFFCPLGAAVDFSDKYIFRKKPPQDRRPPEALRKLKYIFLIGVAVLALFGVWFPLFTDPISFFTRASVMVLNPLIGVLRADGMEVLAPVITALGAEDILFSSFEVPLYYGIFGVAILFVLVFIGGFWDRRFYCQYICPTGAFLGLLSRFALFRRRVSEPHCDFCKDGYTCAKVCPTRAVDNKDIRVTSAAECVVCGVCTDIKDKCSGFGLGKAAYKEMLGADIRRRQVMAGCASGLFLVPVFRSNAVSKNDQEGRLVRPPGAVPEEMFKARCIGCGECVKACPTNSIQLCTFGDGINRLYTPKIVPRIGGCEEKCYLCGHVCPTGAIRKLTYEQKRFAKIGTAVINKDKCLPWEQNKECLVCDETCPYNAITTKMMDTHYGPYKVPVVDEDLCLGCGICEEHCPIYDEAAIVVFNFSENRRAKGDYVSERQKKEILDERRKSDQALGKAMKDGGEGVPEDFENDRDRIDSTGKLPEGFIFDEEEKKGGDSKLPDGFTFD